MPRKPSMYKPVIDSIPEFIKAIENSQSEKEVDEKCQQLKASIDLASGKMEGRRDPRTMTEIRRAINEKFPVKPATLETVAEFPYYFSSSKKEKEARLEHVAHKYLVDERNPKREKSEVAAPEVAAPEVAVSEVATPEVVKSEVVKSEVAAPEVAAPEVAAPEVVKSEIDILKEVGLTNEDLTIVKEAIGDADIKEWVKQAMIQRAKAVNNLNERLAEDLSMVSSEKLMNDKKYRTNTKACRELTSRTVRAIKKFNAQSPEYRWCITNALISEITGNTVKAIAKAVEGMDIESYNRSMDLQPVNNRLTKAAIGEIKNVVSIKDVLGIDE